MASLLPGYEYDIFISYRQKDNKGDMWVSEFVDALKTELESTCKEEISVYFDINPHDGLLETHDVDASLREKLRCLIFIPVISRTYCDPISFAWEHEFKAYIDQASKDEFGLKIKLTSGNVTGRVLPVQIHDLNADDKGLLERELGGVLRPIEFIYRAAGVNRALRLNEDHPHDNLTKTYYRDQINKVANTIDEIIRGLMRLQSQPGGKTIDESRQKADQNHLIKEPTADQLPGYIKSDSVEQVTVKTYRNKKNRIIYSFSLVVLVLSVVAFFLFTSGSTLPFSGRDWIVITDFENLTGNPVFDNSLYTAFSLTISQSSYINVFPRSRMLETLKRMQIKDLESIDDKTGREIAIREGINIYIVPSISQVVNKYIITARILETKTGNILRSEILYADTQDQILATLDKLSNNIRRNLGESRYRIAIQAKPLSKVTTSSLEALKQYSLGVEYNYKLDFAGAKNFYENALRLDTGFVAAKASLGHILLEQYDNKEGIRLLDQAVRSVNNLTDKEKYGILAFYAVNVEKNLIKGIEKTRFLTEMYPDDPAYHHNLGFYLQSAGKFTEAVIEYKRAVRLNANLALSYGGMIWVYLEYLGEADSALIWSKKMIRENPMNAWGYFYTGSAYVCLDSINKSVDAFLKAREINPYFTMNIYRLAHSYSILGHYPEAIRILEKIHEIDKDDISVYYNIGLNYKLMGNQEEANNYFMKFKLAANEVWLKKFPEMAETYITLGVASARLNDTDSSQQMLQKAMAIDSTAHSRYAEMYSAMGKIPEAIGQIEKALENGFRDIYWLKADPDLQPLQNDVRLQKLLGKYFK